MMRLNYLFAMLVLFANPVLCLASEEGGEEHGGIGGDLAFWSLVTFVGFVFVVRKLGWQGFVDGLNERERREIEAIAGAESKNRDAQQHLSDRKGELEAIDETTRGLIEEARRDAERTQSDISAAATKEVEALKGRALREIERTRDQSLKELFDTMAVRVVEQTEQRLRESLTDADQERLMDESLAQFTASAN